MHATEISWAHSVCVVRVARVAGVCGAVASVVVVKMWRLCGAGERGLQGNGALRGASACETWMQARARALDRRSVAGAGRIVAPKAVVLRPCPVGVVWCW